MRLRLLMGWLGLAPHPQSNIVRQLIGDMQTLKPGAAGAAGVQRLAAQGGGDLQARDDEAAAARRGSGQGDQAGGLIVVADEDFLPVCTAAAQWATKARRLMMPRNWLRATTSCPG